MIQTNFKEIKCITSESVTETYLSPPSIKNLKYRIKYMSLNGNIL